MRDDLYCQHARERETPRERSPGASDSPSPRVCASALPSSQLSSIQINRRTVPRNRRTPPKRSRHLDYSSTPLEETEGGVFPLWECTTCVEGSECLSDVVA